MSLVSPKKVFIHFIFGVTSLLALLSDTNAINISEGTVISDIHVRESKLHTGTCTFYFF